MINLLIVGFGGFIGAISRYLLSDLVATQNENLGPILGTASVNILGCLLFGLIIGLVEVKGLITEELRLFMLVGILGGFTTFSTFGAETFFLLEKAKFGLAIANVLVQVITGVTGVWLGFILSKQF